MNALTRDLVNLVNTAEENQTAKEQTSGTQFREKLHLMPPVGWLNDPNGLCQMDGVFHAFFQYSPFNAEGGVKMWGHYTSTNLIDWEYKGVSLYPDQPFDCHGVYSGSAFLEDGTMYLYYTGNVKLEDGYITISAAKGLDKDEKDKKNGKYIRRERYAGSMSRSFYVGEDITEDEISAKFENGILQLKVPKKDGQSAENKKCITIEG